VLTAEQQPCASGLKRTGVLSGVGVGALSLPGRGKATRENLGVVHCRERGRMKNPKVFSREKNQSSARIDPGVLNGKHAN